MPFKVKVTFMNGDADDYYMEDVFDSEEEAEEAAQDEMSNWSAGADVLDDMGESFIDPYSIEYEIEEE